MSSESRSSSISVTINFPGPNRMESAKIGTYTIPDELQHNPTALVAWLFERLKEEEWKLPE